MTDKEQIIINGVDISGCEFLTKTGYCKAQMSIMGTDTNKCKCFPNCYFKQLQKEKFENLNNRQMVENAKNLINENSELCKNLKEKEQECDRYHKALEEIEDYIYNNTDFDINDSIQSKTAGYDILQIIKGV